MQKPVEEEWMLYRLMVGEMDKISFSRMYKTGGVGVRRFGTRCLDGRVVHGRSS